MLDAQGLVNALIEVAGRDCDREHLRTYWYDGARDLVPTAQQLEIANLPNVKLRLGRLTKGGQKGVDSRIVRDLITLSLERAITDAYLLGGDEDLGEGVAEAQERGVHVALIGIEPLNEQNLSPTLAMEADQVVVLGREFLEPHLMLREPDLIPLVEPEDPKDPGALGRSYALAYVEQKGSQALAELAGLRNIPPEIDRQLLFFASRSIGTTVLDWEFRAALRAGFHAAIQELASKEPSGQA